MKAVEKLIADLDEPCTCRSSYTDLGLRDKSCWHCGDMTHVDTAIRLAMAGIRREWMSEEIKGKSIVPVRCPACDTGAVMFLGELLTTVSPELTEAIQWDAFCGGVMVGRDRLEWDEHSPEELFADYLKETKTRTTT